ncbi:MAG TPA: HAMP domain-containing sensor histidine kinase, partial [Nocardioides sp.]|nr:HAMP domain-containing sensor histidine kinase [Nocardioides sp.]
EASQSLRTATFDGEKYRVVAVPMVGREGSALVMAQSLDERDRLLSRLGVVTLLFGGLGVLVAGVAGWAVARNGLRPVRNLTTAVEGIARTEELRPMAIEGDDEVARLSAAFNQMLVALDASRERQRRLVADAGHELRTPLTSLRTNVDLLTQADAATGGPALDPEARLELLDDIRGQIEELTTLIGDLTELSREAPPARVVELVDLSEVLGHAAARVRRRAPSVTFDVDAESWWLVGEANGLERAITNLLDNAAKWSPPGGTVTARLAGGVLTVDDEGPGIREEDRPHVFERFWRAKESRTMPGSGLGLSIVAQVAERHAGVIEIGTSPAGGARLTLTLPGRETPDD